MITMTRADDDALLEELFVQLEAAGHDMTKMRAVRTDLAAIETGAETPPHGLARALAFAEASASPTLVLPPMHEGPDETAEGKFYLPPFFIPETAASRHVVSLRKKIRRLHWHVAVLYMLLVTFFVIGLTNWWELRAR